MINSVAVPAIGRRRFIGAVAAAVGAGVLAGPGRGLLEVLPFVGDHAPFTRTEVLARIGEPFRIVDGAHAGIRLVIDDVVELPGRMRAVVLDDQFAARFVAERGVELASDTYVFATKSFGELPLFVSPLVDGNGVTTGYEALVNRYVPPAAAWALRFEGGGS